MSTGTLIVIGFFIILFIRPLQMLVIYVEKMVSTNIHEDFVDFERRANDISEKLKTLGPVRTEDLPELFKQNRITSVSKKGTTP